ncbi:heavy-metal-associated domain-containing protein [Branchiibius cervicis]|uniref:Heavy-metal-associated domain-containing protein n=1 Tax=Branchiibius cervicis TaxID=908252 RepID=A0ABW2AXN6_9MICO
MQQQVKVSGMTCEHCVRAVTEELTALDGVSDVHIELISGGDSPVTILSEDLVDPELIAAAVDEAGYQVVTGD